MHVYEYTCVCVCVCVCMRAFHNDMHTCTYTHFIV